MSKLSITEVKVLAIRLLAKDHLINSYEAGVLVMIAEGKSIYDHYCAGEDAYLENACIQDLSRETKIELTSAEFGIIKESLDYQVHWYESHGKFQSMEGDYDQISRYIRHDVKRKAVYNGDQTYTVPLTHTDVQSNKTALWIATGNKDYGYEEDRKFDDDYLEEAIKVLNRMQLFNNTVITRDFDSLFNHLC